MIKKGPELVAVAIMNTLESYLPAVLTAIGAAWNDDIPLPPPEVYYPTLQVEIPEPTALVVDVKRGRQTANSANSSDTEGWGEISYEFEAFVYCCGDDATTLMRRGHRYAQALWEVLMQHQTLDGTIATTGLDLGDMLRESTAKDLSNLRLIQGWTGTVFVEQIVG